MEAVCNLNGIETAENNSNLSQHVIIILLVKPSDANSAELISQFNYYHFASRTYCAIYAPGYSIEPFPQNYDSQKTAHVDGNDWYYSDRCFAEFVDQLENRTKWQYCGEPEILILQSGTGSHSALNFSNYVSLDIMKGIREGYIDSPQRMIQELLNAARTEVEAKSVLAQAKRLSISEIAKAAIESASPIPKPIKEIIKDRLFYRSATTGCK